MQGDSETAWAGPAAAAHDNWVSKEDFHTKFSDLALKFERLETVVEERGGMSKL